jgi:hypothetical protein
MLNIDVNHWRNLQTLLLDSAKERRRIVVIHEDGEILKFVHSHKASIVKSVERVDDPQAFARRVHRDNADKVDFVAVFERRAFDEYFGRLQGTWRPDEDLDEFVRRTYALMDEYPEGLVTFPGRARHVLGLQWRLGTTYSQAKSAVDRFVLPRSTVVFGIFDGLNVWATLVLGFDAEFRIDVITTVDMSEVTVSDSRRETAEAMVAWASRVYRPCSVGLFTSLDGARRFLESGEKTTVLRQLARDGDLIADPVPDTLAAAAFEVVN